MGGKNIPISNAVVQFLEVPFGNLVNFKYFDGYIYFFYH